MAFKSDYELTAVGNVKVANYVVTLDKRNGYAILEFDARGKPWGGEGAAYSEAMLVFNGQNRVTIDLKDLQNHWQRFKIKWYAASEITNINWGDQYFQLRIHDEDNTEQLITMSTIELDLDPAEYHMDIINQVDFGEHSAPGIEFTLKDLHNKNMLINPIVTKIGDGSTSDQVAVTFDFGSTAIFPSGFVVLGGVKFSECILRYPAHASYDGYAAKAYMAGVVKYTVDTPSLTTGDNSYKIDLACESIGSL